MRIRIVLAIILLAVGLCLVPTLGYGEIREVLLEYKADPIDVSLLKCTVIYIMVYHEGFLVVMPIYDKFGLCAEYYPAGVKTKGKIEIVIKDNRGIFYGKQGKTLLSQFEKELETFYVFIKHIATDMDTDIVAKFTSIRGEELGYFYQGEYYLWEK